MPLNCDSTNPVITLLLLSRPYVLSPSIIFCKLTQPELSDANLVWIYEVVPLPLLAELKPFMCSVRPSLPLFLSPLRQKGALPPSYFCSPRPLRSFFTINRSLRLDVLRHWKELFYITSFRAWWGCWLYYVHRRRKGTVAVVQSGNMDHWIEFNFCFHWIGLVAISKCK